eukprot:5125852-Prymnesium_polylepis.1
MRIRAAPLPIPRRPVTRCGNGTQRGAPAARGAGSATGEGPTPRGVCRPHLGGGTRDPRASSGAEAPHPHPGASELGAPKPPYKRGMWCRFFKRTTRPCCRSGEFFAGLLRSPRQQIWLASQASGLKKSVYRGVPPQPCTAPLCVAPPAAGSRRGWAKSDN